MKRGGAAAVSGPELNRFPKDMVIAKGVSLMLDSGAWSVYSKGAKIDIQQYIEFIKQYRDGIDIYVNLDVIGDWKATWKNQEIMEKAGLKPMPVYHVKEPIESLYRCLDYDYFGLGGTPKESGATRWTFFDRCFSVICDTKDRLPRAKIHGFGVTGVRHMLRYPWYSVDSTSWTQAGGNGNIYVPYQKPDGTWEFHGAPDIIKISARAKAKSRHMVRVRTPSRHFEDLPASRQEQVLRYIGEYGYVLGRSRFEEVGHDYELKPGEHWMTRAPDRRNKARPFVVEISEVSGVCNDDLARRVINGGYLLRLQKMMPEWPWPWQMERQARSLGII